MSPGVVHGCNCLTPAIVIHEYDWLTYRPMLYMAIIDLYIAPLRARLLRFAYVTDRVSRQVVPREHSNGACRRGACRRSMPTRSMPTEHADGTCRRRACRRSMPAEHTDGACRRSIPTWSMPTRSMPTRSTPTRNMPTEHADGACRRSQSRLRDAAGV